MITKTEEWLYNKAKEEFKDLELQDLYTAKFSFGGRWVMDLLEEYHAEQLLIHRVSQQRELLIGLLTKIESYGGNNFINKEGMVDLYLKSNL